MIVSSQLYNSQISGNSYSNLKAGNLGVDGRLTLNHVKFREAVRLHHQQQLFPLSVNYICPYVGSFNVVRVEFKFLKPTDDFVSGFSKQPIGKCIISICINYN